ncbi:hypothetical protein C8J57DRAFT_1670380 [Mycena rebaudengoi]|nr:hypothetical protein C8J57DRAFT_1670380 [Mycena rebaudengoi]
MADIPTSYTSPIPVTPPIGIRGRSSAPAPTTSATFPINIPGLVQSPRTPENPTVFHRTPHTARTHKDVDNSAIPYLIVEAEEGDLLDEDVSELGAPIPPNPSPDHDPSDDPPRGPSPPPGGPSGPSGGGGGGGQGPPGGGGHGGPPGPPGPPGPLGLSNPANFMYPGGEFNDSLSMCMKWFRVLGQFMYLFTYLYFRGHEIPGSFSDSRHLP